MTIGLSLITGLQAMDQDPMDVGDRNLIPQWQQTKELTPIEKKNVHKIWLMKQHFEKSNNEGTLPKVPRDVQYVICQTLHELFANPVLDGELVYKDRWKKAIFINIMDLINEKGCIDLSNQVFGNLSDSLTITTAPEVFFRFVEKSYRLLVLIAPKFLIEEKIETTAKPFQPIMANWNEEQAPIGIFYRVECYSNLNQYDHLITENLFTISENSLCKLAIRFARPLKSSNTYKQTDICRNFMFIYNKS